MDGFLFDRFLLFHPQDDLTYIRKLSMSYGYYTALAVVNDSDRVTYIGVSNSFQIVSFKELTGYDQSILGYDRCSGLSDDDLLSIYRIDEALKLKYPYKLLKSCRNMRYTLPLETYELKKLIVSTLDDSDNRIINKNNDISDEYNTAYRDQIVLDLDDIDLTDNVERIELPNFNSLKATGQTRLI